MAGSVAQSKTENAHPFGAAMSPKSEKAAGSISLLYLHSRGARRVEVLSLRQSLRQQYRSGTGPGTGPVGRAALGQPQNSSKFCASVLISFVKDLPYLVTLGTSSFWSGTRCLLAQM